MRSKLPAVPIPDNVSAWDFLRERLQHHSEKNGVAFIDGPTGRCYTYRELLTSICNVSCALLRRGFLKGDILFIVSANCYQFPLALHGAIAIGGIVTTCNPQSTVVDIRRQLESCAARWIVTSSENIAKVKEAVQYIRTIKDIFVIDDTPDNSSFSALTSYTSTEDMPHIDIDPRNDVAMLLYSSGTTGNQKGIMHTHYNLIAEFYKFSHHSVALSRSLGKEVYIAVLPFYHQFGNVFLNRCLANGDTVVIYPSYSAASFIESIQTYKATVLVIAPPIAYDMLLFAEAGCKEASFTSVHTVVCGASPLSPDVQHRLKQTTGIRRVQQVYGLSEAGTVCVPEWDDDEAVGSVGNPAINVECKIVNHQTGEELGIHQDGELLVRSPSIMKGYHKVPSESNAVVDADQWLHTGDMAHYDDCGRFYIVDRYKQIIKHKGFQVIPSYLEDLLLTHPAVADVAVIGLPDARAGELPAAFVVPKVGVTATEEDIKAFVDDKVVPYSKLRGGVIFVEELPRTITGKLRRHQLRDEALRKRNNTSKRH